MSAQERLHHESVQALLGLHLVLHHKTLQEQFSNQVVALDPAPWVSSTLLLLHCVCGGPAQSPCVCSPWLVMALAFAQHGGYALVAQSEPFGLALNPLIICRFPPSKVHLCRACQQLQQHAHNWCQQSPPSQAKGLFASPLHCTNCLPGLVPPSLGSHAPPSNAVCRPRQPLSPARPDAPTPLCQVVG